MSTCEWLPVPQFSPLVPTTAGEDFILRHGQFWTAAPLPPAVPRGQRGQCYLDAVIRAQADPDVTYVEGIAWLPGAVWEDSEGNEHQVWLRHAWTVDDSGVVTDATWERSEDVVYFGVPIPAPVAALWLMLGAEGVFGELPPEADGGDE